jgi:drug/metabolite transporter (DMT)-like permease
MLFYLHTIHLKGEIDQLKKEVLATILLVFVTFFWGATFVIVQNAIAFIEPFSFNAVRFLLAALILLPFWLKNYKGGLTVKQILISCGVGFISFTGYLLQTFGLLYTTSSKSGFITGICVIFVPVFLFLLFRERSSFGTIIACIIALFGLKVLTSDDHFSFNIGDALTLCCAVAFAFHIILSGKYSKEINPLTFALIQIVTVGVCSSICSLLFEKTGRIFSASLWQNNSFVFAVIITALFCTSIAYSIQMFAQKHISSTKAALIFILEPVFAAMTSVLYGGETLTMHTIYGGALIVGGMFLSEIPLPKKFSKVKNEAM